MRYQVIFTGDGALPEGTDWALVTTPDGVVYCLLKESRVSPDLLSEVWAAWEQTAARVAA